MRAVLRASVAVENTPYALIGSQKGFLAGAASCDTPIAAVASCGDV